MTIYEDEYIIPMLYIEEDSITWLWFKDRCTLNRELYVDNGFLIPFKVLEEHYIVAFRSYIEFEYYDSDSNIYDSLMNILGMFISFVDRYINNNYYAYICCYK